MRTVYPRKEDVRRIMLEVADHYNVDPAEMKNRNRERLRVHARRVAIMLIRRLYPQTSNVQIARLFGRDDHTWITDSLKALNDHICAYPDLAAEIEQLTNKLNTEGEEVHEQEDRYHRH